MKKVLPGRREDGKRSLSYYDILKRLNGLPAKREKVKKLLPGRRGRGRYLIMVF
jgi:hypothetical protein